MIVRLCDIAIGITFPIVFYLPLTPHAPPLSLSIL